MIDVKELRNEHGELKDGYAQNPDFSDDDSAWALYNTQDCLKELRRVQRTKGRKHISILLGFGDHLSDWIEVSWKTMYDMVRSRRQRFANCEYTQVWHIKATLPNNIYECTHISVWPTYLRDSNKTVHNGWGEQEEE